MDRLNKDNREIVINNRPIGKGRPVYCVAEMSANHLQSYDQAVKIVEAAKQAGADAVKLQTYTPDTMTINCDNDHFQIKGTVWQDQTLYELYQEAYTPWEWQPKLKALADQIGIDFFSTPFDQTSLQFLEALGVPAYKIASFEIVDLPLLRAVARTGKPIILSTGMANLSEIHEAVRTIRETGGRQLALLKCTSAYPASPQEMNLRTIPHLADTFQVPVGLSDHSLEVAVPAVAVALGACIIEKHFTLDRSAGSPDSSFSLEPQDFRDMVKAVRTAQTALGEISYECQKNETENLAFRRSLFTTQEVKKGETFSAENIRSIRPAIGLHTRYLEALLGMKAVCDIPRGTPLSWELIFGKEKRDEPVYRMRE
jgi:pseudaminic acid synthase